MGGGGCEMYYAICLLYAYGLVFKSRVFGSDNLAGPTIGASFFEANSSPPTIIPLTHSTERRLVLHLLINPFNVLIAALSLRRTIIAHPPYTINPA